jgi:hypothetical protein
MRRALLPLLLPLLLTLTLTLLSALRPSAAWAQPTADADADADADAELIIVALADHRSAPPAVGSTPRAGYRRSAGYAAGLGAEAAAAELERDYGLQPQAAWLIAPLRLHCLLYRIAPGTDRARVLAQLARDPRVQLAQPQQQFETLAEPVALKASARPGYNDPYVGLQRGFEAMGVAEAQRWSRGEGVRVALIDTGLDAAHPDLQGRVASQRDFVGPAHAALPGGEHHGTQLAGVIAAVANNRMGIVGVAPQAQLLSYRACWETPRGGARCDSFTLAQALAAAIAADADIINLSLGGPADPLLARLTAYALQRGSWVVGAMPPGGRGDGFPVGVPGVLAVDSSDADPPAPDRHALAAPGREILTLSPGGSYDFASGSSLAAAHVTGTLALLRALDARHGAASLRGPDGGAVNACAAVQRLRSLAVCSADSAKAP